MAVRALFGPPSAERIFDMKTRYALLLSLMLGLVVAGPALAVCDVTLSSILPNGQAVLKANCGATSINGIRWFQDANSLTGGLDLTLNPAVTGTDIYYTVPVIFSNAAVHRYTATGNNNTVAAGTPVTIAIAPPALNVSASVGGMVVSSPPGINACKNGSGTCLATYAPSATVSLTATADPGFVFSGWGGDCSGVAICTVGMTSVRTVAATFGPVPAPGACGTANGIASATTPTALCTVGTPSSVGNAGNTWNWTCAGPSGGSSASCSAPQIVVGACGSASGTTPLNTTPSGTAACSSGTVVSMVTGTTAFTWGCSGINGGTSTSCSAPIAVTNGACGTANGANVATAPTGTAACSAGVIVNLTNSNNTFSWTCNGLAGGSSKACTAFQVVNGACGASNGGSFSSAPTSNLCGAGTASAVTGSGPFNWSCTGINTGTTASCTASLSTGTASCGPGETMAAGDRVWSPFNEVQLWPVPPVTGSGVQGRAIQIVADSAKFPRGVQLGGVDESQPSKPKDYVVSACPHSFTPVGGNPLCATSGAGSIMGPLYLRFGPAEPRTFFGTPLPTLDCPLTPGGTYYVNFRDSSTAYGGVSSQFVINKRLD